MGLRVVQVGAVLAGMAGSGLSAAQPLPATPAPAASSPAAVRPAEVIVMGRRPIAPCHERDKACILQIAREVWTHYPVEIQFYCQSSRTQKAMQRAVVQELGLSSVYDSQSGENVDDSLPPALSAVCSYKAPHIYQIAGNWVPWSAAPSASDLAAAYPRAAKVDSADARINCKVEDNGHLEDCHLSDEEPADQGFGKAALRLADKFHVNRLVAREKRAEAIWVDVAIHFDRTSGAAAPIADPDWTLLPDPEQTAALYPSEALKAGVATGMATVDCRVGEDGALGQCTLVDERPTALGFGAAALAVAPQLHANLWTRDGRRTVGAHIVTPLRFDTPGADAAKAGG